MVSTFSIITTIGGISAIVVGILFSPIPKNLGLYTYIASKSPTLIGLTPAFHHGIDWNYDYKKVFDSCSDIQGQNALVTGANSGVGFETAKVLAKCGVHVTMCCRNSKRCDVAAEKIREYTKDNGYDNVISTMIVDTSKLKSVQAFSKEFLSKYDDDDDDDEKALDILYLNAGIGAGQNTRISEDGIEFIFATNYVGHHLMYRLLEPLLQRSKMARVIQTSSSASFNTFPWKVATSLDQLNDFSYKTSDMRYYGQSKLAQIVWAKYLTKRLGAESNVYVNAAHPGAVDTPIWYKNDNPLSQAMTRVLEYYKQNVMWTVEEGALTQIYLGTAIKEIKEKDIRGKYYHPQVQEVVNPLSLDEKFQEELWNFSEELVAEFL